MFVRMPYYFVFASSGFLYFALFSVALPTLPSIDFQFSFVLLTQQKFGRYCHHCLFSTIQPSSWRIERKVPWPQVRAVWDQAHAAWLPMSLVFLIFSSFYLFFLSAVAAFWLWHLGSCQVMKSETYRNILWVAILFCSVLHLPFSWSSKLFQIFHQ